MATTTTTSWKGDSVHWPEAALSRGDLRISGTATDTGISWHVARDENGGTTVALVGRRPRGATTRRVDRVVRACAARCATPQRLAIELANYLCRGQTGVEIGVIRVGPEGRRIELLNVSLPTILHWDPALGLDTHAPLTTGIENLANAEVTTLELQPGALLLGLAGDMVSSAWDRDEIDRLVEGLSVRYFGGLIAASAPPELHRLIESADTPAEEGSAGLVAVGLPPQGMLSA